MSANDFESCFMIVWAIDVEDIVFQCSKWLVKEHRRTG